MIVLQIIISWKLTKTISCLIQAAVLESILAIQDDKNRSHHHQCCHAQYKKKLVGDIFKILRPKNFCIVNKMDFSILVSLHSKLQNSIVAASDQCFGTHKINIMPSPPIPHGTVPAMVRLACVIRYFSDDLACDIMSTYNLSHTDVMNIAWFVEDVLMDWKKYKLSILLITQFNKLMLVEFSLLTVFLFQIVLVTLMGFLYEFRNHKKNKQKGWTYEENKSSVGEKLGWIVKQLLMFEKEDWVLIIYGGYGGASSNCLVFKANTFYLWLRNGLLQDGFVFFGDNALISS